MLSGFSTGSSPEGGADSPSGTRRGQTTMPRKSPHVFSCFESDQEWLQQYSDLGACRSHCLDLESELKRELSELERTETLPRGQRNRIELFPFWNYTIWFNIFLFKKVIMNRPTASLPSNLFNDDYENIRLWRRVPELHPHSLNPQLEVLRKTRVDLA